VRGKAVRPGLIDTDIYASGGQPDVPLEKIPPTSAFDQAFVRTLSVPHPSTRLPAKAFSPDTGRKSTGKCAGFLGALSLGPAARVTPPSSYPVAERASSLAIEGSGTHYSSASSQIIIK